MPKVSQNMPQICQISLNFSQSFVPMMLDVISSVVAAPSSSSETNAFEPERAIVPAKQSRRQQMRAGAAEVGRRAGRDGPRLATSSSLVMPIPVSAIVTVPAASSVAMEISSGSAESAPPLTCSERSLLRASEALEMSSRTKTSLSV